MKVSGIISEYNPFHNGHQYHLNETRRHGTTHIVAVMSGSFVQRGDAAIMDKLRRARLAVRSGVDLVIELPVQYSLSSAESLPPVRYGCSIVSRQWTRYPSEANAEV